MKKVFLIVYLVFILLFTWSVARSQSVRIEPLPQKALVNAIGESFLP